MISVRSGRGFGDSLYLQGVARHLVRSGQEIEVCTNYPDVFLPLRDWIRVAPFRRDHVDRVAHYITRKAICGTDQFRDCCISAGIGENVDLALEWSVQNTGLIRDIRSHCLPVVVVQMPRAPMDRKDDFGRELLPDCRVIQQAIDLLDGQAFIVQIGQGEALHRFHGIDLDLANKTTVAEAIDVVSVADACLGYCSFIVPLAESLRKPALLVWSRRGLNSSNEFIRRITPDKIFHRATSRFVVDDCADAELKQAVDALYREIRMPEMV